MTIKAGRTSAETESAKHGLKKRLSQADFAAKLQIAGITMERDSVSRIEIGTRFVADYELMIIAEILDVTVDWLLSEDCE